MTLLEAHRAEIVRLEAALAASRERERALREIVCGVAEKGCEHYPQGAETCFFCEAYLDKHEPHFPDCLWVRAKALAETPTLGPPDGIS